MSARRVLLVVLSLGVLEATLAVRHRLPAKEAPSPAGTSKRLAVLWTSGDRFVAERMVLMYVHASQRSHWFDENVVIVWGPSAKLLAEDENLQRKVKAMQEDGVRFQACIVCARMYGVVERLRSLGLEVKGMGAPLTRILHDEQWKVMTF